MAVELPYEVAAKVKPGHVFEADPTHAMSAVARWTCTGCGDAVLTNRGVIWGMATQRPCPSSAGEAQS